MDLQNPNRSNRECIGNEERTYRDKKTREGHTRGIYTYKGCKRERNLELHPRQREAHSRHAGNDCYEFRVCLLANRFSRALYCVSRAFTAFILQVPLYNSLVRQSRPQRPHSFWSAPRVATSGQHSGQTTGHSREHARV